MPKKLVIAGQGYVGLPVAMRGVEVGYDVVGYDPDSSRVKKLASAESYVEDVGNDRLAAALATGRYLPTDQPTALVGFDVAVISVPTPLREGNPDLSYIESAAHTVGAHLKRGATVVLESTTYPGTTEELVAPILEDESGLVAGSDFFLGYSPERIDPANTEWTFVNTPKIVSGVDERSLAVVKTFYDTLVERTVPVSGTKEAELVKLLENTFRHVNIALVNELAMFAADLGIDVWQAIDAASTKPFGFMPFRPGPGVGGHCMPIDPSYLSWRVRQRLGHSFRFVELANDVNHHMPDYVVRRISVALNSKGRAVRGARVLLLGLAFKKNTGDARESPSAAVAEQLIALGADVRVADPLVADDSVPDGLSRVDPTGEELGAADMVVLLVDHDAFDYDEIAARSRLILDTRNRLAPSPIVERL